MRNSFIFKNNSTKYLRIIILVFITFSVSACQNHNENEISDSFSNEYLNNLKENGKEYELKSFENGEVKQKELVKVSGIVTLTDSKNKEKIKKSDRFVIEEKGARVQVINTSQTEIRVDDIVTVYGEYNGLISANLIEIKN